MTRATIQGRIVNILERKIVAAELIIQDGRILSINPDPALEGQDLPYIIPGFVDSHVHIESSLLTPSQFARLAVVHGTISTVSDPHEIANVCGMKGIEFMIEDGKKVPFRFYFGAPSCVPATVFETAGDQIDSDDINQLLSRKEIRYLSEMMNFPGVLNRDTEVMKKIEVAKKHNKPVDGHAPGLTGQQLTNYVAAGISTDHECFSADEALEKLGLGMKILVREGSAARNFEALADLLHEHYEMMMFCSDDKHPDSLLTGHINELCARSVARGIDVFNVLQAACINPVLHYNLDAGLLREGDYADFVLLRDLENFEVIRTYIEGVCVASDGKTLIQSPPATDTINNFDCQPIGINELQTTAADYAHLPVIEALDGQLITLKSVKMPFQSNGLLQSNPEEDVLKIVVVNRYVASPIAKAFVTGFGLKDGAIASSVAHDSHNIVAVGVSDESIARAINLVIQSRGGVSCVNANDELVLPLPVAGLMSNGDAYTVARDYIAIDAMAKHAGSTLSSPFMTLSFMALLVIPHLKLSDKGLFDGDQFRFLKTEGL